MLTTLLVKIWYDGASPVSAPPPASNTFNGGLPIGAFAFFKRYGTGPATSVTRDPGARKPRGRAKQKRIQDEQRIVQEYLDKQKPVVAAPKKATAAPVAAEAVVTTAAQVAPAVEVVPSVAELAQSVKAMQAQLDQLQETLKAVEFQNKYWARFTTLMLKNVH